MMHLKNIKAGNAKTLEQYELTRNTELSGFTLRTEKTGMRK
ncbi:tail fiber assembly protein GpG [Escherichia coli]|uniref:Tail fiber assembly protein GpG n=1 Tax=Escherichia coli TaxID=562 RepID=A0A376ZX18_ECOLX|nr:tail fiber assembly protein GpG [Escherichia coli]